MKIEIAKLHAASATPADIAAMRDWLKDCSNWENMYDEDFDTLSVSALIAGVDRYYFGGIAQFYLAGNGGR